MLAVAFLPHPPALLVALSAGQVPELADVRTATRDTVAWVLAAEPERVVVLGSAGSGQRHSLRGIGGPALGLPPGPLSVAMGDALLDIAGWTGTRHRRVLEVKSTDEDLGGLLDATTSVLVMGDGSARRHPDAPGTLHPAAVAFDDHVAAALAAGDAAALAGLDPDLGAAVRAAGTGVWRAVGRALLDGPRTVDSAALRYYGAPFGVAYLVAQWRTAS